MILLLLIPSPKSESKRSNNVIDISTKIVSPKNAGEWKSPQTIDRKNINSTNFIFNPTVVLNASFDEFFPKSAIIEKDIKNVSFISDSIIVSDIPYDAKLSPAKKEEIEQDIAAHEPAKVNIDAELHSRTTYGPFLLVVLLTICMNYGPHFLF